MNDIVPVENMKTTSSKIEVLSQAIDLYSAKIYKIGEKDLGTMKNRFTMGIGNSVTILGLDKREQILPIPVTVMNRKITDFCSEPCSIFLIMKKEIGEEKYQEVVYEKTKDILDKIELPKYIKSKIDMKPEIDEAFDNGFNNGFTDGANKAKNDGKILAFRNMIKDGMSRELAQKYTELSDQLVEEVLAEVM